MTPDSPRSYRITVTIPPSVYQRLRSRSLEEGRSTSNLAAFLLEASLLAPEHDLSRTG